MVRIARSILSATLLFCLLCALAPGSLAGDPPEEQRFRWTEEVEGLSAREVPNRLSRPLPSRDGVTALGLPAGLAVDFAHYPSSAEIVTFTVELESLYPNLVERYSLGTSGLNRPIVALRLGNEASGDPDTRPAMYLDGQHHAREPIGQQIVLYTLGYLLSNYGSDPLVTHLLDTRTVYAIPSVNVDGNDIFLTDDFTQRRTASPGCCDDDGDASFDEDPANGAGYETYAVYRYDFDQEWADAHPDDPFAAGWQAHSRGQTYLGVFDGLGNEVPQLDDDGDGMTNEDPLGGVDANRNYDLHWEQGDEQVWSPGYRGPQVWSEPETRAVRDLVAAHENILTGLSYHSGADVILHPWAWSGEADLPDAFVYELLSRKGSQLTERNGFQGAPHTYAARGLGYTASGTTMDWLYSRGIYAWSPETYGASLIAFTRRIGASGSFSVGLNSGVGSNPDPSAILPTVDRWNRFNLYVLAATPNVELTRVSADEGLLALTVANDGFIPVGVTVTVSGEGGFQSTATLARLQAAESPLSLAYPLWSAVQSLTVTLTTHSLAGTRGRAGEVERVLLRIEAKPGPDQVTVLTGRVAGFADLGRFFDPGGWLAPNGWDIPGVYHLGPPLLKELFLPAVLRGAAPQEGSRP
jgi:hypothetical protein